MAIKDIDEPSGPSGTLKEFRAEEFACVLEVIEGWQISMTTYKLQDEYICKIDNVEPGAVIARATAQTLALAKEAAIKKAASRLKRTVRHS